MAASTPSSALAGLLWATPFPGGLADAAGEHALWRDGSCRLVAQRLSDGVALWRSDGPLLPLLLGRELAVGLRMRPARIVALTLHGNRAGLPRWTSAPLPWPDWAQTMAEPDAGTELAAGWLDDAMLVCWRLTALYSQGAPPGPAQPPPAAGACLVALDDGALRPLGEAEAPWPAAQPAGGDVADAAALFAVAPQRLMAQQRLHGRRYGLVVRERAGLLQTALVAYDEAGKRLLWDHLIDERLAQPPPRLRL